MQSTSLSKKSVTDISIYCTQVTNDLFKDFRFVDLMNNLVKSENHSYRFAIYSDLSLISTNIFIPIFNTIYLGSSNHNVIVNNSKDLWLLKIFKNNKYFVMYNEKDTFDYDSYGVKVIKTIREIT